MQPAPATDVAAFLRANPGWLAAHPELYAVLHPPTRVHGDRLADHMAAMLARARAGTAALDEATAARRAADNFGQRVHEAVLALMGAPDPAWCLQHDIPALLQVDGVRLCCETGRFGALIPPGTVDMALGRRASTCNAGCTPLLHGEAAALALHEALMRVPLPVPALLALACRDGAALVGATAAALAFLGGAVGLSLTRP